MKQKLALAATIILASVCYGAAQTGTAAKDKKEPSPAAQPSFRASPAYSEILLRRTELVSSLEALLLDYTEEFPKVKEIRHVLTLVDRDTDRLAKVKPTEQLKLTLALGKLMVRKIELETDLWKLQRDYKDEHPDVKKAKRKLEIYENAVAEVLN